MKVHLLILVPLLLSLIYKGKIPTGGYQEQSRKDSIPTSLLGDFTDDYGIKYHISDTLWIQLPDAKYHILRWNFREQYILAKNDELNPDDPGMFTRIDYMIFENNAAFEWGFCLTVYNASTMAIAENSPPADRQHPKKGCGGFPFSRMKRLAP